MKAVAGALLVGGAALLLGGTSRFLSHGRAAPWVRASRTRHRDARAALARDLALIPVREVDPAGGERLFVWGPLRVAWGDRIRFAAEPSDAALYHATRVHDGWIFHARGGVLFRSDSFLGPLRQTTLPSGRCAGALWIQPSFGRAVVVASAALYESDGGAFTRLDRALPLRAAAFGSAAWGLGIAHGGRVYETRDGGANWSPARSITARASALEGFDGGVRYYTDAWHVLRPGGGTTPAPPRPAARYQEIEQIIAAFQRSNDIRVPLGGRPTCSTGNDDAVPPRSPFALRISGIQGPMRRQPLFGAGVEPEEFRVTNHAIFGRIRIGHHQGERWIWHWRTRAGIIHEFVDDLRRRELWDVLAVTPQGVRVGARRMGDGFSTSTTQLFWVSEHARDGVADPGTGLLELTDSSFVSVGEGVLAWGPARREDYRYADSDHDPNLPWCAEADCEPRTYRLFRRALFQCTRAGCVSENWFMARRRDIVLGAIRDGDRWGILALEQVDDGRRSRYRLAATPGFEQAVASLEHVMDASDEARSTLAPCDATTRPWEFHALRGDGLADPGWVESIGRAGRIPDGTHHAVFEFGPARICLRSIDARSQQGDMASTWLDAQEGVLVGARDDGVTVTPLRGTIEPWTVP